jgi:hypothetical protein
MVAIGNVIFRLTRRACDDAPADAMIVPVTSAND